MKTKLIVYLMSLAFISFQAYADDFEVVRSSSDKASEVKAKKPVVKKVVKSAEPSVDLSFSRSSDYEGAVPVSEKVGGVKIESLDDLLKPKSKIKAVTTDDDVEPKKVVKRPVAKKVVKPVVSEEVTASITETESGEILITKKIKDASAEKKDKSISSKDTKEVKPAKVVPVKKAVADTEPEIAQIQQADGVKEPVKKEFLKKDRVEDELVGGKVTKAPDPFTYEVSNQPNELNQLDFPESILQIISPPRVPLGIVDPETKNQFKYLNENKSIVFFFKELSTTPFKMKVELANGTIYTLTIQPKPVLGVIKKVGVDTKTITNRAQVTSPTVATPSNVTVGAAEKVSSVSAEDIALLKKVVTNDKGFKEEFSSVELPVTTTFNSFVAVPLNKWSNGSKNVLVFQLIARNGKVSKVDAKQFYRDGVTAVTITGDTVAEGLSPKLYIVENVAQ